jgi:uncharacterized protein YjbI with pentapeptide repeats
VAASTRWPEVSVANPEHLEILAGGVAAWNDWRRANPDVKPDLSAASLAGADLGSGATLADSGDGPVGEMGIPGKPGLVVTRLIRAHENAVKGVRFKGILLDGSNLADADLSHANLTGASLNHATVRGANLRSADLSFAKATDADFRGCRIDDARLVAADLQRTKFARASFRNAELQGADMTLVNLWGADLRDAILASADLGGAYAQKADLRGATLWSARLEGSDLSWADLRGAELRSANLENANVYAVQYDRWAYYRGIRISSAYGSPRFRRFAQDQDYIEEFRSAKRRFPLYLLWLVFADCGRSFALWAAWSIVAACAFALKYYSLGAAAFVLEHLPWGLSSVLYYSVVTFTTLGFGDVVPRTPEAAHWVTAEVVAGYVMLGGLVSILATKLARRS